MTPRNPTNSDLLRAITDIKETLSTHSKDINELKEWKIAVEAAKQALKEFHELTPGKTEDSINNKALAAVIGVIGVLAAVILALVNMQ